MIKGFLRKLGVDGRFVKAIQALYGDAVSKVGVNHGYSVKFIVEVNVH